MQIASGTHPVSCAVDIHDEGVKRLTPVIGITYMELYLHSPIRHDGVTETLILTIIQSQ
jgi:hypothetical protein